MAIKGQTAPAGEAAWEVPQHEIHEFAPRQTRYCVCIPVINEGERIRTQLADMRQFAGLVDILILDGGSTDGSLESTYLERQGIRTLLVKRGPGRLSAQLRMGYAYALLQGYEGIVTIDGNNKDGVEGIPRFLEALQEGVDVAQGSRFLPGGRAINTPLMRLLAIRLLHAPLVSLAAGFRYSDTTNGFRAYSRRFLLDPRVQPFRAAFDTYELLAYLLARGPRLGYRTAEVPVTRRYPAAGPIPTKISQRGNLALIGILVRLLLRRYDPGPIPARRR